MKKLSLLFCIAITLFISCNKESNIAPTGTFISPSDSSAFNLGDTIAILADANDPDGNISRVDISINYEVVVSFNSSPYSYLWATSSDTIGTYDISIDVYDNEDGFSTNSISILLKGKLPIGDFTPSNDTIIIDDSISFTDNSKESPISWEWDFGDGNTSTEQNPSHLYTQPGSYNVQLTVTNQYGSDTITKKIFVSKFSTVTDIEGNEYKTVKIKDQWWMAENLRVEYFNTGRGLVESPNFTSWHGNGWSNPMFTWLNDDVNTAFEKGYGALYNSYVAYGTMAPWVQGNVCPTGWHVPTDEDWFELERYIGLPPEDINKMEEYRGTNHGNKLKSENVWTIGEDLNSTGFSAIPAGEFNIFKVMLFGGEDETAYFWSSTPVDQGHYSIIIRGLSNNDGTIFRGQAEYYYGASIRCIKD